MTISFAGSCFEALVTLDAAQPGEVHACLAIYAGDLRAGHLIALFAIVQARMRVHCE